MVQIHACEPPGDVLLFLTGEEEIEDACRKIDKECKGMGDKVSGAAQRGPWAGALPTGKRRLGEHLQALSPSVFCWHSVPAGAPQPQATGAVARYACARAHLAMTPHR